MSLKEVFSGLDNIGVFDRSAPLPTGGNLEQADGTAWMALFSQNMLELAFELAIHDPTYEDMVVKFIEHFYFIAAAMNKPGPMVCGMKKMAFTMTCFGCLMAVPKGSKCAPWWGFFHLCATTIVEKEQREKMPTRP